MSPKLAHGCFFFEDWMAPDPHDPALHESMHTARYSLAGLTQTGAYRILAAAEAYCHFAGHPAPTADLLAQLRTLRRAVREAQRPDTVVIKASDLLLSNGADPAVVRDVEDEAQRPGEP